jgi:hypothetical protein
MTRNTTILRTDGFVRNLHSQNPFDVILADVVLARMEVQAHSGCGLHYEIYHSYLLDAALDYLAELPLKDRPTFIGATARRGVVLTFAEGDRAGDACHALMANLADDY